MRHAHDPDRRFGLDDGGDGDTSRNIRARGIVMVITLFAVVLIASLLFYVYNTGKSVQGRIVTQHAADAAVIGGAGQVARSLNTVAMNNVETARAIAAVNVLDSIPLAVDLSVTDETEPGLGDLDAIAQAVQAQLRAGVVDPWFDRKLREMVDPSNTDGVYAELSHLRELDALFHDQPDLIPAMTHYRAPSAIMGRMHQAMRAMDAHSQAVMTTLGETAQSAASHSVQANLGAGDAGSLLLPTASRIPWERGAFADYERPVRFGLLPGADFRLKVDDTATGLGQVDNRLINRGPWDVLFGWRYTDADEADLGSIPLSGGSPPRTGPSSPAVAPRFYGVHGTDALCLSMFPRLRYARIRDIDSPVYSRGHLTELVYRKGAYLWEGLAPSSIRDTQWEIDVAYDNERSNDLNNEYLDGLFSGQSTGSLFVVVEIKSRLANERGMPRARGLTWNYVDEPGRQSPYVIYRPDWFDPDRLDGYMLIRHLAGNVKGAPTWRKVQDYVWRISAVYRTDPRGPDLGGDPSIGLPPKQIGRRADGVPVYGPQEVFWEIDVLFVGANRGATVEVVNPWTGFDPNAEDAPAPIDLVHSALPPNDPDARFRSLTFLGISRQSNRPDFWPGRFQGNQPHPYNSAIAQAYVFNNHSWDLWTQTWQAQLEPVDIGRFNEWTDLADQAVGLARNNKPGLDPDRVESIAQHLHSVEALAPVMLKH